ncbi:hypothetical protein VTN77DRAFT_8682 [Rasamsonia byssochlamydoides]|uniref:uncharacterized protein n=1 Tax=Rasamsonia byssochlamydoides TaxID=89139 RepID=UPI003743BEEF
MMRDPLVMNNFNLNLMNKTLHPPSPASSRLRDWRGDGAGPPGPCSGRAGSGAARDIASAGDSSPQDDLVPHPDGPPDVGVAVSRASTLSPSPSKRDPRAAAAFPKRSESACFSAMDAKPTLPTALASALSSHEQSRSVLNDPAMQAAVDHPISQPLSSQTQSNGSASPSKTALTRVQGQKRTATGEIKPSMSSAMSQVPTTNGVSHERRMSADSGSGSSSSSRIAELSAQLRARLSYAAAKVEKSWQRQGDGDRRLHNGSPEGTTVSAPDSLRQYNSRTSNHASAVTSTAPPSRSSLPPPQSTPLHQQAPKLAPPADIVASAGSGTRRRPNPNAMNATEYNPYPRHRRHFSEQQARASALRQSPRSNTVIPGSPPLGSSRVASTPNDMGSRPALKHRTPSQKALMEQDAIETLLFMSSPENSSYHPNSQSRQTNSMSIEGSMQSSQSSQSSNGSNGSLRKVGSQPVSSGFSNQPIGPEAQAGHEIDRMLDQMRGSDQTHLSSYDFSVDSWKR